MKKGDGGARQVAGFGSAPAPGFAKAKAAPNFRQHTGPTPMPPDRGQTERPVKGTHTVAQRQGGRHGSTGGGAKE